MSKSILSSHSLAYRLGRKVLENLHDKYGDSFHLLDLERVRTNIHDLLDHFTAIYPRTSIGHSYKTNYIPALCRTTHSLGTYAEVVSGMEYNLAIHLGVLPERILLNGPIKSTALLQRALTEGALVNIDSLQEAVEVAALANRMPGNTLRVGLRCNFPIPGIPRSRFGLDLENGDLATAAAFLREPGNVQIEGLHGHFGGDRSAQSYQYRTKKLISIADILFENEPPLWIDVGGGFAGPMPEDLAAQFESSPPSYSDYAEVVAGTMRSHYGNGEKSPELIIEPGMGLFSDTMEFVCKVHTRKRIDQTEHVFVHGSVYNVKPISSKFNLPVEVIACDRILDKPRLVTVSGLTCMEVDILHSGLEADIEVGDSIIFRNTGAYTIVLKPPFIETAPAILAYDGGRLILARRAETLKDVLISYDPDIPC